MVFRCDVNGIIDLERTDPSRPKRGPYSPNGTLWLGFPSHRYPLRPLFDWISRSEIGRLVSIGNQDSLQDNLDYHLLTKLVP
jgi:hypothetical protein